MPKCLKCGEKVREIDLDRNGVCRRCIAAREDKGAAIRAENLDVCRRRCAKPNIQRIFDGFIAKYPDALLTGISVQDGGDKLLIYLDGKPMYYATFNPLTNSVDLEKHVQRDQQPSSPPSQSSSSHDLRDILFILCGIALLSFAIYGFLNSSGSSSPKPTSAPRQTATSRPTASPTPTSALDDPVAWGKYYARKYMPDDMKLDTVETSISVGETYLVIACNMEQMWDSDDYIRSASELICKVGPGLLNVEGYDHVTFLFYGPFIDRYGNDVQSLGIRAMYSREELSKINFDYFYDIRHLEPEGVIKTNDNYLIHPSYLD